MIIYIMKLRQQTAFFGWLMTARAMATLLVAPATVWAEVAIGIPGCGTTACDNSGGASALWPSPSNFSVCNNTVNPLTVMGWRFKTASWGGYGSNGGGTFTVTGGGPYTYQKKVPLWDQIRPPGVLFDDA